MDISYPMSPLVTRSYSRDTADPGLKDVHKFSLVCDFLDSVYTYASISGISATPAVQYPVPIPAPRPDRPIDNTLEAPPPVNASRLDGSSNGWGGQCETQWNIISSFIRKIDDYSGRLQGCLDHDVPPDLYEWLKTHNQSKEIRNVGLRALGDILHDEIPSEFHEMLCTMIVQHAISHYMCEANSLEAAESAFTGWRNIIPIMQNHQPSLDIVFECLQSADRLSLSNPQPARPHYQTPVFETGSIFPTQNNTYYPLAINDNSLHPHGSMAPDPSASLWPFPADTRMTSPNDEYPTPYPFDNSQVFNSYSPPRGEDLVAYSPATSLNNNPFASSEADAYPAFLHHQQGDDISQSYELSFSADYPQRGAPMGSVALSRSLPCAIFVQFIEDFMSQGNLPHLFAQGSIHWTSPSFNLNTRVSDKILFRDADMFFFTPLRARASQSTENPILQAIISTTSSLVLLGGLHSFADMAEYMFSLGVNLLPTPDSCRDFARIVLQTCSELPAMDVSGVSARSRRQSRGQAVEIRAEEITRNHSGSYYPVHLLQTQRTRRRSRRTVQPRRSKARSRASSSQPPPSIVESLNPTDIIEVSNTTTTTTPSLTSTMHCTECSKSYKGRHASSHLSRHRRTHRDPGAVTRCPLCDKPFNHVRTDNIRTHCRSVHGVELPKNAKEYWASLADTRSQA